jgi:peroxiredoxin
MEDFSLPSDDAVRVHTSDYRKLRSLVLVFLGDYSECSEHSEHSRRQSIELLSDLTEHYAQIVRGSAEVLVVVRGTRPEAALIKHRACLPYLVLADEDGRVHRDYGAVTQDGRSECEAVYVAGRFGRLYLASRASDGPPLPSAATILSALRYIEPRYPEWGHDEPFL